MANDAKLYRRGKEPVLRASFCLALTVMAIAAPLIAQANTRLSNAQILQTWLDAFNRGDAASLRGFSQTFLGNSNIDFLADSREETGGFDLVGITQDTTSAMSALLREKDYPDTWLISFQRTDGDEPGIRNFQLHVLPTTQRRADASLAAFADRLSRLDKFSGVLLVSKQGRALLAEAWGYADIARQLKNTLDTQFYFASQGKMFTSVAILQLVEAGKIGLNDSLGKYLTDYSNKTAADKVTIRHLLTHQDGLGEMGILGPNDGENRKKVHSIADIIKLNGERSPAFEPGSKFAYANYGYLLLGAIIEKVSGETFYDYVHRHIFLPAGMEHTWYPGNSETGNIAIPYTSADGPTRPATDQLPWRGTPAGGGVSTAADMVRFVKALNSGKLISTAMLREATRKQTPGYGYGFIVSGTPNYPFWGHGGDAPGMNLVLAYYPVADTTLVCMANRDPIVCDRLAFNYSYHSPR